MKPRHFPLTSDGYLIAKKWLQEIGKWEQVSTTGFSVDGWSIIETANWLWEQNDSKRGEL